MMAMMKAAAQQQGGSPFKDDYRDACITSGAVGLWMLDETTGTTAVDQGTAGVDGTYYGQLATSACRGVRSAFNIPLAGCSSTDSGTSGNGFLDGVIVVPSDSAWATELQVVGGAISYEFVGVKDYNDTARQYWLGQSASGNAPTNGPLSRIMESDDDSTSEGRFLFMSTANQSYSNFVSPTKQTPGVASHNVVTFDTGANYMRWYRNGVKIAQNYRPDYKQINGSAAELKIGNALNSSYSHLWPTYGLQGAIGGVAFYDYALSQTDVTTHYNALLV